MSWIYQGRTIVGLDTDAIVPRDGGAVGDPDQLGAVHIHGVVVGDLVVVVDKYPLHRHCAAADDVQRPAQPRAQVSGNRCVSMRFKAGSWGRVARQGSSQMPHAQTNVPSTLHDHRFQAHARTDCAKRLARVSW